MVASMDESSHFHVLAIDGGGTRCRIAIGDSDTVVSVETGSANISTDFEGTVREIGDGLERLAGRAGRSMTELSALPAYIGLAGVTGPAVAARLRARLPFAHLRIDDDRPAAVRGALGQRNGVVVHCGTGSFYASQSDDGMRFAGGWGPVLGDEASAQWIGRAALRLTLESVDGRRGPSPLSKHFLSEFQGPAGIVGFAGSARPSEFGALARQVTEFAGRGDALARDVMHSGACEIARSLPLVGWRPGRSVCLTGGIGPRFGTYLPQDMQADLSAPEGEPLDGALSLARDLALEIVHDRH